MDILEVLDQLLSSHLGGEINSDKTKIIFSFSGSKIEIQFWNGERYCITLDKLPDGRASDPCSGKELPL